MTSIFTLQKNDPQLFQLFAAGILHHSGTIWKSLRLMMAQLSAF